jgi:Fe-S-cluster-containing dehydrogenase component
MKKCTLCVDRIYDDALPAAERQPACVLACPAHARFFGDFDDPASNVARMTAERGGFGLLEPLGYGPVNRYLPPREPPRIDVESGSTAGSGSLDAGSALRRLIDAATRFAAR